MKLVVGLGNPGEEYRQTRHNTGFVVLDALKAKFPISNFQFPINFQFSKKFNAEILQTDELILAKPQTFMNRSGVAVKKLIENWKLKIENLYVIHDDLDIPLGKYKIQKGKGPKEHRGILSIEMALGRKDFWRVRIGVDNRSQISDLRWQMTGDEYVLSNFPKEEKKVIDQVINKITEDLTN